MDRGDRSVLPAAALGAIAGMRSFSAPAFLSHHLAQEGRRAGGSAERLLASRQSERVLKLLAGGEMLADKLPFIPARIEPLPLAGRALVGAVTGAALARHVKRSRVAPALAGAATAILSAYAFYYLRREAGRRYSLPNTVAGLAEDLLVVVLGSRLLSSIR